MKTFYWITFLLLSSITSNTFGQCVLDSVVFGTETNPFSFNGYEHTPKDTMHVLVIFRAFNNNTEDWDIGDPDLYWAHDDIPNWAKGASNKLFDSSYHTIGQTLNLSAWFKQMSMGKFIVTGEVFPHLIIQDSIPFAYNTSNYIAAANASMSTTYSKLKNDYPGYNWSKFDRRRTKYNYSTDNSSFDPDNNLDYIFVVDRVRGMFTGYSQVWTTADTNKLRDTNNNVDYAVRHGSWAMSCASSMELFHDYFTHEFAHSVYRSPHYCGANYGRADGMVFYPNNGWGFMSNQLPVFYTANAWERWWLGWTDNETKTITASSTDTLYDFLTTGQAIRIPVPGATTEYLWLEYHNKTEIGIADGFLFDKKPLYSDFEQSTETGAGLYAYVTKGWNDRSQPQMDPFNPAHVNFIRNYIRTGLNDYEVLAETVDLQYNGGVNNIIQKINDNPISGISSYQYVPFDKNNNNEIVIPQHHGNQGGLSGEETFAIFVEKINNDTAITFAVTGGENDGFQVGDELSLSGIMPPLNMPQYNKNTTRFEPKIINGLAVKITGTYNNGLIIQIDFNDRELRENKRWCGDILLPAPSDTAEEALRIKSGKTLLVDLSGTPNRHTHNPATAAYGQPFVNPTLLTVQEDAKVVMESGSEMVLDRLSTVYFETGSSLEMKDGALIRIKSGTFLKVSGEINLLGSAKILIEDGGKMEIMPSATINLTDNASTIEIVGTLQIANGVNFDFTGNGDLVFNKPSGTAYCNIGGTSILNLVGQGTTDVKLKITNNTKASISGPITSEIKFSTCKISLGDAALLELSGKTTFYSSVTDRIQSGQKPTGVRVYALAGSSFSGAWFYNSAIGLDVNLVYSTGNPGFTACKYISNDVGLKIHGKGATISGCTFTSNAEIDLELDANSMVVNVSNCTFNGTGSLGANLKGSSYTHKYNFNNCVFTGRTMGLQHEWGSTSLSNCSFTGLETGVHVVTGTVASTCSEFTSCDYGITLDEFGRFRTNTQARNIFDGNVVGIWLWKGNINIWGGENQFVNNTYDILGEVKPTPSLLWTSIAHSGGSYEFYRWPISRNKFTSLTYPHTFNNVLYGVYGNPDLIQTPYFTVLGSAVEVPDQYDVRPVYIDCVNCGFEFVSCGSGGPGVPIYADYSVLEDESPATSVVLNSTYFNNVELKEAIRIASGNISVTLEYPNNDSLALIHFKDILSQTYATGETEIRDILYAAQHLMGRALSNAYSLEILPLKYEAVPEALNIYAIELIDQLTEYISTLSPSEDAEEIGNATIELALVYRLAAHYTEAIDILGSSEAYNATSGRRDYWDCVCKAEYDLITEAYSLEDFQNQLNNSCNAFINYRKQNPFSKDKIDALLASRQKGKINPIRPNPTTLNSLVRLDVKGSSGAVVITDMSGRTVQRIEAKNGINDIELNASTLDNGVYFVLFFDDNKHLETQKWVVSR